MSKLFKRNKRANRQTINRSERWFSAVSGIVVETDDPEQLHRVKVVIPSIDENFLYDEWVRPLVPCLGDGYGAAFIPPLDSEVVLFGTLGEKFNLFYLGAIYNGAMGMPSEFDDTTIGFKAPNDIRIIAEMLLNLQAKNAEIIAQLLAKIEAQNIQIKAAEKVRIEGNQIEIESDTVKICGRTVLKNGQPI